MASSDHRVSAGRSWISTVGAAATTTALLCLTAARTQPFPTEAGTAMRVDGVDRGASDAAAERQQKAELHNRTKELAVIAKSAADAEARQRNSSAAPGSRTRPWGAVGTAPAGTRVSVVAIAAAESRLGYPYVYGAAGPNSFDCSGLVQWAYAQAGVFLPRTSQQQASAGVRIGTNIAFARPGDLIIYFSGMSHVGLYLGNGRIIRAPHPGSTVRYASATAMPIAAIVRL